MSAGRNLRAPIVGSRVNCLEADESDNSKKGLFLFILLGSQAIEELLPPYLLKPCRNGTEVAPCYRVLSQDEPVLPLIENAARQVRSFLQADRHSKRNLCLDYREVDFSLVLVHRLPNCTGFRTARIRKACAICNHAGYTGV